MSHGEETHWHLLKSLDLVRCRKDEDPSVWLGRVVQNFNCPIKGYVKPSEVVAINSESRDSHTQSDGRFFHFVDDLNFTDMQGLIEQAKSTDSRAQFTDILNVFATKTSSQTPSFTSKSVRRLRIEQEDDAIAAILEDAAVQKRLESMVPAGGFAYLVVAILVAEEEVSYDDRSSRAKESNSGASLPAPLVSAALSALASAPVAVENPVGLNRGQSETTTTSLQTMVKGLNIFAVDYRVLYRPAVRSWIFGRKKPVQVTNKHPGGDRSFGHENVETSDQKAELEKIEIRTDPLYYFESTALEQSFTLVE